MERPSVGMAAPVPAWSRIGFSTFIQTASLKKKNTHTVKCTGQPCNIEVISPAMKSSI